MTCHVAMVALIFLVVCAGLSMTHEEVRECMSEYDVDNGKFCKLRIILNSGALAAGVEYFVHQLQGLDEREILAVFLIVFSLLRVGGVIEMSEFSLFIRNQAKEAERKLKVRYGCAVVQ